MANEIRTDLNIIVIRDAKHLAELFDAALDKADDRRHDEKFDERHAEDFS